MPQDDARLELYHERLSRYPFEVVQAAVYRLVDLGEDRWPTLPRLVREIEGDPRVRAEYARYNRPALPEHTRSPDDQMEINRRWAQKLRDLLKGVGRDMP